MSRDLEERIVRYLSHRMPEAGRVSVIALSRIHGGASRETFRVRVDQERGGERGLIFRRDPVSTLIETEREVEFAAYRSFMNSAVPVPGALFLERELEWLERPFFVMEEVEGCTAGSILAADPYGPHRQKIGEQFFTILGHIAKRDAMVPMGKMGTPEDVANACFAFVGGLLSKSTGNMLNVDGGIAMSFVR